MRVSFISVFCLFSKLLPPEEVDEMPEKIYINYVANRADDQLLVIELFKAEKTKKNLQHEKIFTQERGNEILFMCNVYFFRSVICLQFKIALILSHRQAIVTKIMYVLWTNKNDIYNDKGNA